MHPATLGFTQALAFRVDHNGVVTRGPITREARARHPLLYVAWLTPAERALKIGLSETSLWERWRKVVHNMERPLDALRSLRPPEIRHREQLLAHSRGQTVEVWMIPYPAPATSRLAAFTEGLSLKQAEVLLDKRYAPLFGRPLGDRQPWPA